MAWLEVLVALIRRLLRLAGVQGIQGIRHSFLGLECDQGGQDRGTRPNALSQPYVGKSDRFVNYICRADLTWPTCTGDEEGDGSAPRRESRCVMRKGRRQALVCPLRSWYGSRQGMHIA